MAICFAQSGRVLIITGLLASITTASLAQERPGGGERGDQKGPPPPGEKRRPPIDEKAYKAALDRIPVPKEKYDPWGVVRPSEPIKSKPK